MSIHRNRAKLNNGENSSNYKKLIWQECYPLYYDEGILRYPLNRRKKTKKLGLMSFKIREYRTWKHNRKTKWIATIQK